MTKTKQKPAVLKSCTAAAHAAEAHVEEAATWAELAFTSEKNASHAAEAAHRSAVRAAATVERLAASHAYLTIITGAALIIACVSLALSFYLLFA